MIHRLFALLLVFVLLGSNLATAQARSLEVATSSATWIEQIPAAVPQATYDHNMAYDSQRDVVVLFGGLNSGGLLNDTLELVAGTWIKRTPSNAPSRRYGVTMVYDSLRNETLLFGGCGGRGDTWTWNGTNWSQQHPAHSPDNQCLAAMAFDSRRGVTVLFGSQASTGSPQTWEWDGTDWSLRLWAHAPPVRFGAGMVYDADRGVIVLHGGSYAYTDTWEWDGLDWTLRSTVGPPPRIIPAMAYDTRTKHAVLFGGQGSGVDYGDTWEWDGATGIWSERSPGSSPSPRYSAMVFDEARGTSLLFGGGSYEGLLKDTWEWDSQIGNWVNTIIPAAPRAVAAPVAYDSRRKELVLFSGYINPQGGSPIPSTWVYGADGRWVRRQPLHSPVSRLSYNLAYDSRRGVTVLFGGVQATNGGPWTGLTDTWEWDGVDWTRRYPANSPTTRTDFALAYDSVRDVIVFFGGRDGGQRPYGDTWTWDGNNWTQQFPLHSPSPRWAAEMAFDSARGVMVLFGGSMAPNEYFTDTWEWDGSDWILRSPANSPPARDQHGLAYDSARGVTVLFGGTGPGLMNDTWEWDGTNWTQVVMDNVPSARAIGPGMEYDIARHAVVLFGGSALTDETWEYRSANNPPTVDAGGSYTVNEGGVVVVTAFGNDPEGGPLAYEWDLDNDGTFETSGQSVNFSAAGLSASSSHIITVRVTDDGGLTATDKATVFINYSFSGFFPPVDNLPMLNVVKGGAGVAVKFSLGRNQGLNIFASGYPISQKIACDSGAPWDDIEQTVNAGGSSLNYDPSTNTYSYTWKTEKTWAGSCRQLIIKLSDGSEHKANFRFK